MTKPEIGERLKNFRKAIDKTQKQLHDEAKIAQSNIARIEVGKMFPSFEFIAFLHIFYKLNLHWLITGEGEMQESKRELGESLETFLSKKYSKWKPHHLEMGKEIFEGIKDTFILTRMSSYLEVAKHEKLTLLPDKVINLNTKINAS